LVLNDSKKIAADVHRRHQQLVQMYESDALELGAWMGMVVRVYPVEKEEANGNAGPSVALKGQSTPTTDLQRMSAAQVSMSYQAWMLSKAQRLPYFQVGWVQQSFQGYQQLPTGDRYFDRSMQFSQYQVGLRLPVLGSANRRRSESLKLEYQASMASQAFVNQQVALRYEQLTMALFFWDAQIAEYREVLLPSANEQLALLSLKRDQGEISGVEWGVYMREAMQTQIDYFDALHQWESVQIELQYFNPTIQ
jgi:cobalt-zinc-cadmium resistance protein CzcA